MRHLVPSPAPDAGDVAEPADDTATPEPRSDRVANGLALESHSSSLDRPAITTYLLDGFDDPRCSPTVWEHLVPQGDTATVFQTWHWLRAWWDALGDGQLLLVAAERGGEVVAVAPLYLISRMVYFLGCGEADYLDFVGNAGDPDVLTALLKTIRDNVPDVLGFRFHALLERSSTVGALHSAAARLDMDCYWEGSLPAIEVDLAGEAAAVRGSTRRSMLKREEAFRSRGRLEVHRIRTADAIRPHLPAFYEQHVARWEAKQIASPFVRADQRAFVGRLLDVAGGCGSLRFLRIDWDGRPLAFEYALYYRGVHYSAPWCFAIEEARWCPGHVLLRQSLLAALDEGLQLYDLGLGDQEYKFRLPVRVKTSTTWGLYP